MHDKQVRRRRAVLVLLVGASLILLTAYFGESESSPLHTVQRGIVAVLSPVQQGASTILSPVRGAANWVSDTLNAKSELSAARAETARLHALVAQYETAASQNAQLQKLVKLDGSDSINAYSPVTANVIGVNPSLWYQQLEVDRGANDGVVAGDPVIGEGGLVGEVFSVWSTGSEVRLLTDSSFAVGAEVINGQTGSAYQGVLVPQTGNPTSMLLTDLPPQAQVNQFDQVVTSGFVDPADPADRSLYPPGIAIGTVANQNTQDTIASDQEVQVSPIVDLRGLSVVQILTKATASTQRAQVP